MNILFITTLNLATNPRLVKELKLALDAGYGVTVICFEFDNWSKTFNDRLKAELGNVKIICIAAGRKPFWPWFSSVVRETLNRLIAKVFSIQMPQLSQAVSRRSSLLVKAIKNISGQDLVIGHNPGALYATFFASQKFNCKAGFDVEDYHPGEGNNESLQKLTKKLMQFCLPKMDYVSFAAPLIREAVKKDLGSEGKNWITVLNYFPQDQFQEPVLLQGPLKLVWFSQHIAGGRGLELVLPMISKQANKVELHLYGNVDKEFYEECLKGMANVKIHEPLPQKELHKKLSNFDIGLAVEPGKDRNNNLAVSNKLLAYLQAGLYVLASDTAAQKDLMTLYPQHARIINLRKEDSSKWLTEVVDSLIKLRSTRRDRYQQFNNSWEKESTALSNIWRRML